MKRALTAWFFAVSTGFFVAAPAHAALILGPACTASAATGSTSLTAAASCGGYYGGNLNGGSTGKTSDAAAAVDLLLGINNFAVTGLELSGSFNSSTNVLTFGTPLVGQVVLAIHEGNSPGTSNVIKDRTVFYLFNFTTPQTGVTLSGSDAAKFSNASLYVNNGPVPEPATWMMMLLGFGGVGMAIRRRKSALLQLANQ